MIDTFKYFQCNKNFYDFENLDDKDYILDDLFIEHINNISNQYKVEAVVSQNKIILRY